MPDTNTAGIVDRELNNRGHVRGRVRHTLFQESLHGKGAVALGNVDPVAGFGPDGDVHGGPGVEVAPGRFLLHPRGTVAVYVVHGHEGLQGELRGGGVRV